MSNPVLEAKTFLKDLIADISHSINEEDSELIVYQSHIDYANKVIEVIDQLESDYDRLCDTLIAAANARRYLHGDNDGIARVLTEIIKNERSIKERKNT